MQKTSQAFKASQKIALQLIQQLLSKTNLQIRSHKLDKFISEELPSDYLSYMTDISHLLHMHRQPSHTRNLLRTITEPNESISRQLRHPHYTQQLFRTTNCKTKASEEILSNISSTFLRKKSLCLSQLSRKKSTECQGQASRKNIYSRRKIAENSKLVPLLKGGQELFESGIEDRISNLRKRKIKLQQAMKAFKQEEKPEKPFELKKSNKENESLFTTDFKGRIINFNPKPMKNRNKQTVPFTIRYQTMVESSRSQNVWSKLTSNTRRVQFRQAANAFNHQTELQKH